MLLFRRILTTRKLWLVGLASLGVVWKEIDDKEALVCWFSKSGCCWLEGDRLQGSFRLLVKQVWVLLVRRR